jgi:hypothetical protein
MGPTRGASGSGPRITWLRATTPLATAKTNAVSTLTLARPLETTLCDQTRAAVEPHR